MFQTDAPSNLRTTKTEFVDLAPHIIRQRVAIEGIAAAVITPAQIEDYLSKLSAELKMVTILDPITHKATEYGWAGWIHWETSGAHFYAWDNELFFSVDVYTCRDFSNEHAVEFTRQYFNASAITHKAV